MLQSDVGRISAACALLSGVVACDPGPACKEVGSQEIADSSVATVRGFLAVAAGGDSVQITRLATDSLAERVLLYHRHQAAAPLREAAESFRVDDVEAHGCDVQITFRYQSQGRQVHGLAETTATPAGLRVTDLKLLVDGG
jgi:hypothetical protein